MEHEISAISKVIFNEIKKFKNRYYVYCMALKHKPAIFIACSSPKETPICSKFRET